MLDGLAPPRRIALAFTVASFLGLSTWELARPATNPYMDMSRTFTDHFSHMNAARLFCRFGTDVWRKPLLDLLPRPTPAEREALPDEVKRCHDCLFVAPGWSKPIVQSWPQVVRFYPPGDMVLTAPVAALYHFTSLSLADANRLLLVLFLAAAHVGIFLILDGILTAPPPVRYASLVAGFLGVNVILRFTLEGFYDGAVVAPLLLSWRYLGERRGLASWVAFCAAVFIHFRALYYVPWAIAAVALVVRQRSWRTWRGRDWTAAFAGALMAAASLGALFLAMPGLVAFRHFTSPVLVARWHVDPAALATSAMIWGVAAFAFLWARSRIDLAVLGWLGFILTQVRQSLAWYPVAAVPWMVAPPRPGHPERAPLVVGARVLVFLLLALYIHADPPHEVDTILPTWVLRLLRA